jgi:hypothetical protein
MAHIAEDGEAVLEPESLALCLDRLHLASKPEARLYRLLSGLSELR